MKFEFVCVEDKEFILRAQVATGTILMVSCSSCWWGGISTLRLWGGWAQDTWHWTDENPQVGQYTETQYPGKIQNCRVPLIKRVVWLVDHIKEQIREGNMQFGQWRLSWFLPMSRQHIMLNLNFRPYTTRTMYLQFGRFQWPLYLYIPTTINSLKIYFWYH